MAKQFGFREIGWQRALCQIWPAWLLFLANDSFSFSRVSSNVHDEVKDIYIGRPRAKEVPEDAKTNQGKRPAARRCSKALRLV